MSHQNPSPTDPEFYTKPAGKKFAEQLLQGHLILDGPMGTMIQQHPLEEADFRGTQFKDHPCDLKGNNDLLTLTRSDLIKQIHIDFLEAGSDIVETNTFSSTSISKQIMNLKHMYVNSTSKPLDSPAKPLNTFKKTTPLAPSLLLDPSAPPIERPQSPPM